MVQPRSKSTFCLVVAFAAIAMCVAPPAHADDLLFQVSADGTYKVIQSNVSSTGFRSLTSGGNCGGFIYPGGTTCIFWQGTELQPTVPGVVNAFSVSSDLYTYLRNGISYPGGEFPLAAFDITPEYQLKPLYPFGPSVDVMTNISVSLSLGFSPVYTNSCSTGYEFNVYNQYTVPQPGCLNWTDGNIHELAAVTWNDSTVDHIEFQYVPEPQTLALLGSGLLPLIGFRRRARR